MIRKRSTPKNYSFVIVLLLIIFLSIYHLCSLRASNEIFYISSNVAILRSAGHVHADEIESLDLNEPVRVLKKGKVWWKVQTAAHKGYIHSSFLSPYNPEIYFYKAQEKAEPIQLSKRWAGFRDQTVPMRVQLHQAGNDLTGMVVFVDKLKKQTTSNTIQMVGTVNFVTWEITLIHNNPDGSQQCLLGHLGQDGSITGIYEHIGKTISCPVYLQPLP